MQKPRTTIELIILLDKELSWRRVDLLYANRLVGRSKGADTQSAIRASIPLLYAHWEGFVKRSACHYSDFLSSQRLNFSDVKSSFAGLKAQSYVIALPEIKKKIFVTSELLDRISAIGSERVKISLNDHIERVGNLSHEILMQIVRFLSLPEANYTAFGPLIDDALLYHRNRIAHGEYLAVDVGRYHSMHTEVVALIERLKYDIENAAVFKTFKR